MIKSIDHIVILVHDLEAAVRDYTELGFTVVQGGEHAGGVSRNALIAFSDGSYLELIAFTDNVVPESHPFYRPNNPEGLVTYALLPTDIEADIQSARERGLTLDGPFPGGRLRPDGNRIEWQTARPLTNDLPFLCGDITPRDLRVPSGAARVHKNGALGIDRINISVANIEDSISRYRALLGSEPLYQHEGAGNYSAEFKLDQCFIDLASGENWYSEEHGEGPDALVILCDEDYAWESPPSANIRLLPSKD